MDKSDEVGVINTVGGHIADQIVVNGTRRTAVDYAGIAALNDRISRSIDGLYGRGGVTIEDIPAGATVSNGAYGVNMNLLNTLSVGAFAGGGNDGISTGGAFGALFGGLVNPLTRNTIVGGVLSRGVVEIGSGGLGFLKGLANNYASLKYTGRLTDSTLAGLDAFGDALPGLTARYNGALGLGVLGGDIAVGLGRGIYGDFYDIGSNLALGQSGFAAGYNGGDFIGPLAIEGLAGGLGVGLRGVRAASYVDDIGGIGKYTKLGFDIDDARYLAEPYSGQGHHFIGQRNAFIPDMYMNGPLNILSPRGISRGDFYELHYKVDPYFYGTRLPGGTRWSGNDLGLTKYNQIQRIWYGSPTPLKLTVGGGTTAGTAALANWYMNGRE